MRVLPALPLLALPLLIAACSGKDADSGGGGGDGGSDGDDGSDGGTTDGERSLSSCETSIDDDVPDFYKTYFRCVDISMSGSSVVIQSIDLPPHPSPYYEEGSDNWTDFDERGGTHFQNPNQIAQQDLQVSIPADPVSKGLTITEALVDEQPGNGDEYHGMPMGIALDSVALFHGVAAPGDLLSDEAFTFDLYEGHPEGTGVYHYHSPSPGPLEVLEDLGLVSTTTPGAAGIEVYGIMCDGTVLLGCTELDGSTPAGDFDAQGGHVHDLEDTDGVAHFEDRYHIHMCEGGVSNRGYTPEIQYYTACTN